MVMAIQQFQILLFDINYSIYQIPLSYINNLHAPVWFQTNNNNNKRLINMQDTAGEARTSS